jgi:hypothetical protein
LPVCGPVAANEHQGMKARKEWIMTHQELCTSPDERLELFPGESATLEGANGLVVFNQNASGTGRLATAEEFQMHLRHRFAAIKIVAQEGQYR